MSPFISHTKTCIPRINRVTSSRYKHLYSSRTENIRKDVYEATSLTTKTYLISAALTLKNSSPCVLSNSDISGMFVIDCYSV